MEDKQEAAPVAEPATSDAAAEEAASQDEGITKADVEVGSAADADAVAVAEDGGAVEVAEAAPAPVEPEAEADTVDNTFEDAEDDADTVKEDAVETGLGDDPVSVLRALAHGQITREEAREWLDVHYPE